MSSSNESLYSIADSLRDLKYEVAKKKIEGVTKVTYFEADSTRGLAAAINTFTSGHRDRIVNVSMTTLRDKIIVQVTYIQE